ncbi:MAG TPA: hypothetical protein EYN29_01255, partial [Candidatus Marinimicrobia bacterium]|nr:hypothetical protein [Candidatus Neomarinimicrobiota bacterium]
MFKIKLILTLIFGLMMYTCMSPNEDLGVKTNLLLTQDVGGYCVDLGLADSIIIAAAEENSLTLQSTQIQKTLFLFEIYLVA